MSSTPAGLALSAPSLAATHQVAGALAKLCRAGDTIVLAGEMGAGKTAFAQGFGVALGVTDPITSPTFTLVQSYRVRGRSGRPLTLHHADIYRLDQLAEVADLAFGELAEFDGIVLVEWGDAIAASLGDHLEVRLETRLDDDGGDENDADDGEELAGPGGRHITVSATGSSWAHRWSALESALTGLELRET